MKTIKTSNLTKKYHDKVVVNNFNITIKEHEIFALLGLNGAGKTTTINMLITLLAPTSGKAQVFDYDLLKESDKIKEISACSFQENAISNRLTVYENLMLFARIYGLSKQEAITRIAQVISQLGLEEYKNKKNKILSGGYKRRLSIAIALVSNPKILYLDEPTLGLDVLARRELWKIVKSLKNKVSVILTTHYLEEAEALADTIGVINKGNLIIQGDIKTILQIANKSTLEEAFIKLAGGEEL